MQKQNKILIIIGAIILVVIYIGLIVSNIYLQQQIDKKNIIINKLTSANEFMEKYLDVVKSDSSICYVFRLDHQGNRQTYKELGSEVDSLKRELVIKDQIFMMAKHKYHFNVRYKLEGDSLLIYSFYDSQQVKVLTPLSQEFKELKELLKD